MEKNPLGVRRGAWTIEEDILLRKCVEKYGEGKWHQVPLRAGLNRCRKSCRLRWLNYLRPNIKRGYFNKDEVDLIVRLHKLLGNRWSLIAGRLPGRTANDVKNFWNTHIDKKHLAATGESTGRGKTTQKSITESNILRPRPRTVSKLQTLPAAWSRVLTKTNELPNNEDPKNRHPPSTSASSSHEQHNKDPNGWTSSCTDDDQNPKKQQPSPSSQEVDECIQWWSQLLEISDQCGEGYPFSFSDGVVDHQIMQVPPILLSPGSHDANNSDQDRWISMDADV